MNSTPSAPSGAPKDQGNKPSSPNTAGNPVAPEESQTSAPPAESPKRGRALAVKDKMRSIMPWWAWILVLGLVAAVLASLLALGMMKSGQNKDRTPAGGATGVSASYPAPTTTGKYDKERETNPVAPPNGGYVPPAQQWVPEQQAPAETSASEEKTSQAPKPQSNRGERPNRSQSSPNGTRPSGPGNNSPSRPNPGNTGGTGTGNGGTNGGGTGNNGGTGTGTGGNSGNGGTSGTGGAGGGNGGANAGDNTNGAGGAAEGGN